MTRSSDTHILGLAGWSGAGKTTLITRILPILNERGLTVSTLKHGHHRFDIDHPGKDSFKHREAGAKEVLIASKYRWALMHELGNNDPLPPVAFLLRKMSPVDLIIIEGVKDLDIPKIEVHRTENRKPFLYSDYSNIKALITDMEYVNAPIPVISLNDINTIASQVLTLAESLEDTLKKLDISGDDSAV